MRTAPKWVNKIHEAEKQEPSSVRSICFSPDGSQLIVGAGEQVMVYDPNDGALIQLLKGHKGPVYSVCYAKDGRKFASGGADKTVIIWTSKLEGVLKYSHNEAIQCMAYNPVTFHLASCAISDLAFWSAEVKAVQKHRISGRITSCCWSSDGQLLAVGLASGYVSIRNKLGEEKSKISRDGSAIWALSWSGTNLIVGDWAETLSFYDSTGEQVLKERNIGLSPMSLSSLGELILVSGIGGWAVLTSEGVPILNTNQEWVWCIQSSPTHNLIAIACQDGTLWCYQAIFSTVHGLYRERYAYRENMTDVIIQHLTTEAKVRIKCHDRVQKIAIYKHRLAVQLPERVVVYEQGDVEGMLYRVKEKLTQKTECSLLVATSNSLLLCQDTRLTMIGGKMQRSWNVPAPIRYVKVAPIQYTEVLMLGLSNGEVWKVELDNSTAKLMLKTPAAVRCLDVSATKNRVAVVDEHSVCRVYSLPTYQLLFQEENVSSVSWNCAFEELLCMSGGGTLYIKAGQFPAASQPLVGSVVGFQGGRVFCLQANAMQTISVPLSHAMYQYIEHQMYNEAYAIACLGVTSPDWEYLGFTALQELSLQVARKAFQRSENIVYLQLIDMIQEQLRLSGPGVCLGEILAYRGKYSEAARSFRTAGRHNRAFQMYTDLRMFNKAQEFLGAGDSSPQIALIRKKAEWAKYINEPRAAAEMFLAAGDVERAAEIMAENGWIDMLMDTGRLLDKGDAVALRSVAAALARAGKPGAAADVHERLGDSHAAVACAVAASDWSRAFAIADKHPECRADVYVPYANAMAQQDRFIEAQKAYHMGGQTDTALRVLGILIRNAITEERFVDAGYLHWLLATQCLDIAKSSDDDILRETSLREYYKNEHLASIYYAYDIVHHSTHERFSSYLPDTLFNVSRYVLSLIDIDKPAPRGVSLFCLYLSVAKQSKVLGLNKIAKQMLDRIQGLRVPPKFQESVELLALNSLIGGGSDEDASPICWRCRRHVSPLAVGTCEHCHHKMHFSHVSFEVLPLVEFLPENGIPLEECLKLIESVPLTDSQTQENENLTENTQILQLEESDSMEQSDPFISKFDIDEDATIVICNREELLALHPSAVLLLRQNDPLPMKMYRNMLPDLLVVFCPNCYKSFYMEDFELQMIMKGHCPFCRYKKKSMVTETNGEDVTQDVEDMVDNFGFQNGLLG